MRNEVCVADRSSDAELLPRLFIHCRITKLEFLIDTSSDVTVVPITDKILASSIDYKLFAVNGSKITTYSTTNKTLDFGLHKRFKWTFIIGADITRPIIGAYLKKNFHLLPDLTRKRLVDGKTFLSANCVLKNVNHLNICTMKK